MRTNGIKLMAVAMIFLMISLPITYAQNPIENVDVNIKNGQENKEESKYPEDIIIEIDSYEPVTLVSSLIEENDIPIYANLRGLPANPFISVPKIRRVFVPNADLGPYVRRVSWIPPQSRRFVSPVTSIGRGAYGPPSVQRYATLEDLGYFEIILKKVPEEEKVPDAINIDLTARILYDLDQGTGINEQDLVLAPIKEQAWLSNLFEQEKGAFWSERGALRNGFLRLDGISDDGKAKIVAYGPDLQGEIKPITTFVLSEEETSNVRTLTSPSESFENKFRVKVNSITDSGDKARLRLTIAGKTVDRLVSKGELIHKLSTWRVKEITKKGAQDIVLIENTDPTNRATLELIAGVKRESSLGNVT